VLAGMRDEAPLGVLAPRGGPLTGHYDALAEATRPVRGAAARDSADSLSRLLSYHAELLRQALELAARWWPSEHLARERRRLRGLGVPTRNSASWSRSYGHSSSSSTTCGDARPSTAAGRPAGRDPLDSLCRVGLETYWL
jgi:hypothetical protein